MSLLINDAKVLSVTLKKARKKKNLTQASCAELLNYSTSFQKDLERCRCSPSIEVFYQLCRTLNISADDCIFPDAGNKTDSSYNALLRLISQCDENQIKVLTATAEALLENNSTEN